MFEGKNILVAGGAGFIGVNLVRRLVELGANVRATLHEKPAVWEDARAEYVTCDLTEMEDCVRVCSDMDMVFMCAAFSHGAAVIQKNPVALVTPNAVMNAQMLDAAYQCGVRKFVWPSSSVVYPPSGQVPCREEMMMGGEVCEIYYGPGWMKRYGEILCNLYSNKIERPMAAVVVRPANIYGPYDNFDFGTSHVMAATIRKAAEGHDPVKVWGTGEDVRDFIYIDDFVDGMLLAAEKMEGYDPVNIASGEGYTVNEVLKMALEIEGRQDAEIVYESGRPSMIPVRLIDNTKAKERLGFECRTGIREGIAKTIEWYKQHSEAETAGQGRL